MAHSQLKIVKVYGCYSCSEVKRYGTFRDEVCYCKESRGLIITDYVKTFEGFHPDCPCRNRQDNHFEKYSNY